MKKAHFLIIRIKIKDEPVVSFFLKLLFLLPFPLFIIRVIINFIPKKVLSDAPIEKEDLKNYVNCQGCSHRHPFKRWRSHLYENNLGEENENI